MSNKCACGLPGCPINRALREAQKAKLMEDNNKQPEPMKTFRFYYDEPVSEYLNNSKFMQLNASDIFDAVRL